MSSGNNPNFNRKKSQDPARPRTLADIGLGGIAVPVALSTNKSERKEMKRVQKKTAAEEAKAAAALLAERKQTLEVHRDLRQEREKQEKMEKALLKRERREEHRAAQDARDAALAADEQRTLQFQRQQAKQQVESALAAQQRAAIEQRIRDQDTAERARLAPKAVSVVVRRTPEIIAVRDALPVRREEQAIVEAVLDPANDCVLIASETGGGKTTQIPQFLWEAGFGQPEGAAAGRGGMIAVTEPRRVAAIAMAKRVAEELNEPFGRTVCYSVRYANNLSPECRLKFMTEGVLLRELQDDFILSRYSVVVIDEAHERSVSCDVLLGMLSRLVQMRKDMALRGETTRVVVKKKKPGGGGDEEEECVVPVTPLHLIVMSATLRISDFRENRTLFRRPPPLIDVPVRRFPVHMHFARKTELSKYCGAALKKVKQIHKKLPPGGILVFLSTQREIEALAKDLEEHYAQTRVYLDHFKVRAKRREELLAIEAEDKRKAATPQPQEQKKTKNAAAAAAKSKSQGDDSAPAAASSSSTATPAATAVDEFGYAAEDYVLDAPRKKKKQVRGKSYGTRRQRPGQQQQQQNDDEEEDNDGGAYRREKAAREVDDDEDEEPVLRDEFGEGAGAAVDEDEDDDEEEKDDEDEVPEEDEDDERGEFNSMHILPLFAMLSHAQQQRVFEDPPAGKRLCVIATNIAETSITIPNIRYVVDAGRVRNRRLGPDGVDRYQVEMVSQASAEQRAGRAGRTSVGHCYRLYTPAVFANIMPKHNDPEVLRVPLDSVVMLMKSMRIRHVRSFPFPAPPPRAAVDAALVHLQRIGALDADFQCTEAVGARIGHYPLAPRLARILLALEGASLAHIEAVTRPLLPPTLLAGSSSSSQQPQQQQQQREQQQRRVAQLVATLRDAVLSIIAVCTAGLDPFRSTEPVPKQFRHDGNDFVTVLCGFNWFVQHGVRAPRECHEQGLLHKVLTEALQLRRQLDQLFTAASSRRGGQQQQQQQVQQRGATTQNARIVAAGGAKQAKAQQQQQQTTAPAAEEEESGNVLDDLDGTEEVDMPVQQQQAQQQRATPAYAGNALFKTPFDVQLDECIRRVMLCGFLDQACRRATPEECRSHGIKYVATQKCGKTPYWDVFRKNVVFVHSRSTASGVFPAPDWIVYTVASSSERDTNAAFAGAMHTSLASAAAAQQDGAKQPRIFVRGVTGVTIEWLNAAGFKDPETDFGDDDDDDAVGFRNE